jgi:hypothetical protein
MSRRGVYDRKGELFAYLDGNNLLTLEGEVTGRLEGDHVVDMAGNRIWRVFDSGLYPLDEWVTIGYFGESSPDAW